MEKYLVEKQSALEQKFDLKFDAVDDKFDTRDKALELQAIANNTHFNNLNHEAQRILKATEITVSRDTWNEFLKSFQEWKSGTDRLLQNFVPRVEFQSYKEATQTALTLKAGQTQGTSIMMNALVQIISSVASAAVVVGVVVAFLRH